MPRISVIIPTYNRADLVGHAIQSVLDQTYSDWEIIVVDDGSTDHTRDVVSNYTDHRIRYIYQDNLKLPGARNTGIQASLGKYVAFLDSDDRFLPDKLERQIAAMERNPELGLVASGSIELDSRGKPLRTLRPWLFQPQLTLQNWLYHCPFAPSDVLVQRNWLIRVGLFDVQQHYVEDWDLWLRLSYTGCQMSWEPTVLCLRAVHEGSMARNATAMTAGMFRLLDKFFAQPGLPEAICQQRDKVYAQAHLFGAVRYFGAGVPADGEANLKAAIQLDPTLLEGEPPGVLQSLASTALTHQVQNGEQYVRDMCESLPRVSPRLSRSPRQMHALVRATAAFEALVNKQRWEARKNAVGAILLDPTWLYNRGMLSIILKP